MSESGMQEISARLALVNRFFTAYNEMDLETVREVVSHDILWEHHNKFQGHGVDGLVCSLELFNVRVPGRAFSSPHRVAENGNVVFMKHGWTGTPKETLADFNFIAGVQRASTVASILVIENGRIVEWSDYA